MPLEEQLRLLLDRMDMANAGRRTKLARQIKREILKVRRQLALKKGTALLEPSTEDEGK